jgi:hypothetical protein
MIAGDTSPYQRGGGSDERLREAFRLKTVNAYSLISTGMQLIKGNGLPSRRV